MFCRGLGDGAELRLLHRHHALDLYRLIDQGRGRLRQWMPWVDRTRSARDTQAFIERSLSQLADGTGYVTGIFVQGTLVGVTGLHDVDTQNRKACIGYWVDAAYEGRGLVTRGARALIDFSMTDLGLERIEIACAPENTRSAAVPKRLGFKLEGTLRQVEWLYDHYVDHEVYGLLHHEWVQSNQNNAV